MIRRGIESRRGVVVALVMACALLLGAAGCAQVLGLEEWSDPPKAGAGGRSPAEDDVTSATSAGDTGSASSSGGAATGGCQPVGTSPTCTDCTKNGQETGVDCGGDTCAPCGPQDGCHVNTDCLSGNCNGSRCEQGLMGAPCHGPEDCMAGQCQASTAESTCQ